MAVEELFRDQKSRRNGFGLRLTLFRHARRFDRLLLALGRGRPGRWCSNNRDGACSAFTAGRQSMAYTRARPQTAFAAAVRAASQVVPK
jgi:hypothetical protein